MPPKPPTRSTRQGTMYALAMAAMFAGGGSEPIVLGSTQLAPPPPPLVFDLRSSTPSKKMKKALAKIGKFLFFSSRVFGTAASSPIRPTPPLRALSVYVRLPTRVRTLGLLL